MNPTDMIREYKKRILYKRQISAKQEMVKKLNIEIWGLTKKLKETESVCKIFRNRVIGWKQQRTDKWSLYEMGKEDSQTVRFAVVRFIYPESKFLVSLREASMFDDDKIHKSLFYLTKRRAFDAACKWILD